jgi:FkbM family methyltransferase
MEIKNKQIFDKINDVQKTALVSKLSRLLQIPIKYIFAIVFRELIYKWFKHPIGIKVETFFGTVMKVLLPAGTDIYLTGGKSHDSEIRLAKYLIKNLKEGDIFIDVGAHFGYFSLLAAKLVNSEGKVISFEPSPKTFNILKQNAETKENMVIINNAVSDQHEEINFYEFPNRYSEYNSTDVTQYEHLGWFKNNQPKCIKIETVILSEYFELKNINPSIIKIDVEGSEFKVINGLKDYLINSSPKIIMEFLTDGRFNEQHILAEKILRSLGYTSSVILDNGDIQVIGDIVSYMVKKNCDSENIVFIRTNN